MRGFSSTQSIPVYTIHIINFQTHAERIRRKEGKRASILGPEQNGSAYSARDFGTTSPFPIYLTARLVIGRVIIFFGSVNFDITASSIEASSRYMNERMRVVLKYSIQRLLSSSLNYHIHSPSSFNALPSTTTGFSLENDLKKGLPSRPKVIKKAPTVHRKG